MHVALWERRESHQQLLLKRREPLGPSSPKCGEGERKNPWPLAQVHRLEHTGELAETTQKHCWQRVAVAEPDLLVFSVVAELVRTQWLLELTVLRVAPWLAVS